MLNFDFFLSQKGLNIYLILFLSLLAGAFGLPIPEDIPLIAAGVLIHEKETMLLPTFIICYIGIILGDVIIYSVGRFFGPSLYRKKWFKKFMKYSWFRKFAPRLFNEGKICKLQTPLVIIKDNKENIKDYFFDLDSFKAWEQKNPDTKLKIFYQKGLGSMERSDIKWLLENKGGLDQFLYELEEDKDGFANVDLWLTGDAEPRKEKLRKYTLDINPV